MIASSSAWRRLATSRGDGDATAWQPDDEHIALVDDFGHELGQTLAGVDAIAESLPSHPHHLGQLAAPRARANY